MTATRSAAWPSSTRARLHAVPRPTDTTGTGRSDATPTPKFTAPAPGPQAWRTRAACRSADPELFFPEPGDTATAAVAVAICHTCPVATACLDDAIVTREAYGIRGGLTPAQRRVQRRQRRAHSGSGHSTVAGRP